MITEQTLLSEIESFGRGFTANGPENKTLPRRPDLVLPKFHPVVFVSGYFWQGHEHCCDFRLPGNRRERWREKLEGNRAHDARVEAALREMGWHVITRIATYFELWASRHVAFEDLYE